MGAETWRIVRLRGSAFTADNNRMFRIDIHACGGACLSSSRWCGRLAVCRSSSSSLSSFCVARGNTHRNICPMNNNGSPRKTDKQKGSRLRELRDRHAVSICIVEDEIRRLDGEGWKRVAWQFRGLKWFGNIEWIRRVRLNSASLSARSYRANDRFSRD